MDQLGVLPATTPIPGGLDLPPYRLSGTVVGALLNDPAQLAALGEAAHQAPHKAPPKAPVLEVKPRHTWSRSGATVAVPADPGVVVVGASLGLVIGQVAARVPLSRARDCVAACVLVADLSLPLPGHYRPSVRLKARDGFCVFAHRAVAAAAVVDPDALTAEVEVDGVVVQSASTAGRVRGVAQLVSDVSDFMTLQPGDILLLGPSHAAPQVRAGQRVCMRMAGVGELRFELVSEQATARMTERVGAGA